MDHSCQASANKNSENSERRRSGLSTGKGMMECTAGTKSDICDCLVFCVDGEVQIWCKMLERTFYTNRSDAAL